MRGGADRVEDAERAGTGAAGMRTEKSQSFKRKRDSLSAVL